MIGSLSVVSDKVFADFAKTDINYAGCGFFQLDRTGVVFQALKQPDSNILLVTLSWPPLDFQSIAAVTQDADMFTVMADPSLFMETIDKLKGIAGDRFFAAKSSGVCAESRKEEFGEDFSDERLWREFEVMKSSVAREFFKRTEIDLTDKTTKSSTIVTSSCPYFTYLSTVRAKRLRFRDDPLSSSLKALRRG